MTLRYRFVPHTADVKFIAYAKTEKELIINCALAMFETIADIKKLQKLPKNKKFKIKVNAQDMEDLVWKVLQHTLSIAESKNLFCYSFNISSFRKSNGYKLSALICAMDKLQTYANLDVKGVSKYQLEFYSKPRLKISVVLDV